MTPEEMRDRLSELGIESEFVSYPNKKAIGVKWQVGGIVWKYDWYGSTPQALSTYMHYSPEQAIAATVGDGEGSRDEWRSVALGLFDSLEKADLEEAKRWIRDNDLLRQEIAYGDADAATVGTRTDLSKRLREVHGLHAFAELFGFSWTDESDWSWHDVACAMADAIDATVGTTMTLNEATEYAERFMGDYAKVLLASTLYMERDEPTDQHAFDVAEQKEAQMARTLAEALATVGVGTCHYNPDDTGFTWWDENDVEHYEEYSASEECGSASCDKCGFSMLVGDDGWFDGWDEITEWTEEDGSEHKGYVLTPRFKYCPRCGRKVAE